MKRKLFLLLAIFIIVSALTPSYAALAGVDDDADAHVEITRGPECAYCPKTSMLTVNGTWSSWMYSGASRACSKIPYMHDYEQTRSRTVSYQCPKCGYGYYSHTETASQWICGH